MQRMFWSLTVLSAFLLLADATDAEARCRHRRHRQTACREVVVTHCQPQAVVEHVAQPVPRQVVVEAPGVHVAVGCTTCEPVHHRRALGRRHR